ncbi:MAG: Maf family nucleotide pyrophosphatase [Pseudomonadota bacterium]
MIETNIVLASGSRIRRELLENAGLNIEVRPADIDEEAIKSAIQNGTESLTPADIALVLAQTKAQTVSEGAPAELVIGADQVLACNNRIYSKPGNKDAARDQLVALRGKSHELISAVAVARNGEIIWSHEQSVVLHMRDFSNDFLGRYLAGMGSGVTETVGGYKLEGLGVHLFEKIDGDYFTVLGLPVLPLLAYLRTEISGLV